ncbi:MAG: restriction endonuclease subunit S [Thermoguttaceae bacterium]|nr:restriction endonuclease subunit S [Thermoguttaceae bacterium]
MRQIEAEKASLTKAGKLKKEKPLPPITEEEKPFEIPEHWTWTRLGNIGSWAAGATPSRSNPAYYRGNIPWLKTGDLNDGYISETSETISELALEKTSVRLNPIGSVLMAMYGATIGKLGVLNIEATTNQACCACIPFAGMLNKFLFYFLMAQRTAFIQMGAGGAQPNISKEKIVRSLIPLPPLAEQARIVAKLEESWPEIERYAAARDELEALNRRFPNDLRKAVLQSAIRGELVERRDEEGTGAELLKQIEAEKASLTKAGKLKKEKPLPPITEEEKPFEIPEHWTWTRLVSVAEIIMGQSPKGEATTADSRFMPLIGGAADMKPDSLTPTRYTKEPTKISKVDDVILCIRATLGKPVFADKEYCLGRGVAAIRSTLPKKFIRYFFLSFEQYLYDKATGTTFAQVTGTTLAEMPFPLPPLAEQARIVAKLEEILPLCDRLR